MIRESEVVEKIVFDVLNDGLSARAKKKLRERIISASRPFIRHISRRYDFGVVPKEDLIAHGEVGALEALEKFRPELGYKFTTFAGYYIRKEMLKAIGLFSRDIVLPAWILDEIRKLEKTKNLRRLNFAEEERLYQLMEFLAESKTISLDTPFRDSDYYKFGFGLIDREDEELDTEELESLKEIRFTDVLSDKTKGIETILEEEEIKRFFRKAKQLPEKERAVVAMRFGFEDGKFHLISEIAEELGFSEGTVSRHLKRALDHLGWILCRKYLCIR
ncbi:MAG: sigma-70 family RNA polymerase sigma factor [Candidatus Pacebacteria bacterium]|nr:sigma-70 family RNA polymerase sigma factor [Candidatus Paceibacterota bacterium]